MKLEKADIVIVGAGPAGLATANTLQQAGYSVLVLDKGPIAAHIAQYPTYMTFFSTSDLVEIGGLPLILPHDKPTRQEYLNYLRRFVKEKRLQVKTGFEVEAIEGEKGKFTVKGEDRFGEGFEVNGSRVVLATGAYDTPIMLNVPGEDLPKVSHYFTEVHPYFGSRVLVVGGRNSAVETALELWRSGIEVSILHRNAQFGSSVKYWILPDIENRIKSGEIKAYRPARVLEIKPHSVVLQVEGEAPQEIQNDFVLALTGYRPNPNFLAPLGINVDPKTSRPSHNPATLESNRPGVYLCGVMLAGNVSSEIFIENSRTHGDLILAHLRNGAHSKA